MEQNSIKAVTRHDIDRIAALRTSIFKGIGKIETAEEEESLIAVNKQYMLELFDKNCFCGFYDEVEGRIISIALGVILAFPPINMENQGLRGYIYNVYTDKGFRNHGKATMLTQMLVDELKSRGAVKIELDANENSIEIYEKIGFKISENHMVL
ncbi:GNAT family N-acetyltransferase [Pseudobacteroides cellulosolvens]|uniref:GCN5-related N-acetyltransferase n=1 Tax=Pseudobacteroides cellulosolvens ATCC 35603 = DSM 2933 TaxID=398512 RepID=A0A0L6JHC2_9FIRM|nr:GNAT family N-acetyltransferase [Pseudobacteroides cellulosolvens]KNY25124.1 GCN5-related N-acetyltransferase [Pseudobacteroides cellulosolvens ATCC 35603 = DSM 2933]